MGFYGSAFILILGRVFGPLDPYWFSGTLRRDRRASVEADYWITSF